MATIALYYSPRVALILLIFIVSRGLASGQLWFVGQHFDRRNQAAAYWSAAAAYCMIGAFCAFVAYRFTMNGVGCPIFAETCVVRVEVRSYR